MIIIKPFAERYIAEAALLFTEGYSRLRLSNPGMPLCHEDPATIMPLLSDLCAHNSGAVALSDGKMVGYLLGMHLQEFMGSNPGVYCPEWAHAAAPGMEDAVYTALFEYLAPNWVSSGAASFAVTVLAGNQPAIDAWFWNGFGLAVIDAVRHLAPIDARVSFDMLIRHATNNDLAAVTNLLAHHISYMKTPPVGLMKNYDLSTECVLNRINQPGHMMWVAEVQGEVVGMIEVADSVSGASHIVSGGRGVAIQLAHVLPEWRSKGIASALLNTVFTWASEQNTELCSVDFEAYNPSARRFWLRYFSPVCFSLMRRIVV